MTTSPTPPPTDTTPATTPDVEARIARLRATCAQLEDDLVGITVSAPTRRSTRLLQDLQARLHAVQHPITAPPTTTWIPTAPSPSENIPELAATTPVTIASSPSSSPLSAAAAAAAAAASMTSTAASGASTSVPDVVIAAPAGPSFTVLVGDTPPAGLATASQATTTTKAAKPKKKVEAKTRAPAAPSGPAAPSLRAGAVLHGLLTALSAAATATPLTLGLAVTTTVTTLIAGARRGLWSRLGQLAGLGTIASIVVALWPLGERLSYGRPVGEEELLVPLPQVLLALQSLRLVWRARGRATPKAPPSSTAVTTTTTKKKTKTTPAAVTPVRPGLIGLTVAIGVAVAVDLALLLLAVGPVWSWLWRSSRGWLALALLVMAIVDRAAGRRGVTGVVVVGLGIAVAVVLGVGAWNLCHAMFHDVFSLARAGVAVVVGVLALALTARVIRRRHHPDPGASR